MLYLDKHVANMYGDKDCHSTDSETYTFQNITK
jgi:hypothetical protein